ncbi:hypothetical protein YA29_16545 [Klebsiella aerogenes]|uniref:hypothetical protein n=1 Tax=Klebsiella aerogenes TaxID=548 RepID=UPI00063C645B|nr:hypothetical protein [Klebsiella aerogenes]KLF28691.1 hypothetical protein YA29_16545 [Klebsiella aerogenes]
MRFKNLVLAILLPVTSLYSGGLAALLWSGLSLHHLSIFTFIVFYSEFHDNDIYNVLMIISWAGFALPSFILATWFFMKSRKH